MVVGVGFYGYAVPLLDGGAQQMVFFVVAVVGGFAAALFYQVSVGVVGVGDAAIGGCFGDQLVEGVVGIGGASFFDLFLPGAGVRKGGEIAFYFCFSGSAVAYFVVAVFVCEFAVTRGYGFFYEAVQFVILVGSLRPGASGCFSNSEPLSSPAEPVAVPCEGGASGIGYLFLF